jgi:hypothetical protein
MSKDPVREGHWAALDLLADQEAYLQTRAIYRGELGPRSVYLRPTDGKLTAINVDYASEGAMVGVGDQRTQYLTRLPPSIEYVQNACRGHYDKVAAGTRTDRKLDEARYAMALVGSALDSDLSIAGLPGVYFVHHEWRLAAGKLVDIVAVEPAENRLVVIELKRSESEARRVDAKKGGNAWDQAQGYADLLYKQRFEYYPFFCREAQVLGALHDAPPNVQMAEVHVTLKPRVEVMWPDE